MLGFDSGVISLKGLVSGQGAMSHLLKTCHDIGIDLNPCLVFFIIQMKEFLLFHWSMGISGLNLGFKGRNRNICSQLNCRGSFRYTVTLIRIFPRHETKLLFSQYCLMKLFLSF